MAEQEMQDFRAALTVWSGGKVVAEEIWQFASTEQEATELVSLLGSRARKHALGMQVRGPGEGGPDHPGTEPEPRDRLPERGA